MTDTERIDWLERELWGLNLNHGYGVLRGCMDTEDGDLRKAIDRRAAEDANDAN